MPAPAGPLGLQTTAQWHNKRTVPLLFKVDVFFFFNLYSVLPLEKLLPHDASAAA